MRRLVWNVLVNGLLASAWFPQALKPRVLRLLGARVASGAVLRRRVDVYGRNLDIAEGVFVNVGTQIQNYANVTIGRNVQIGPRVTILTVDHAVGGPERRAGEVDPRPVIIDAGSWIAAGATILPGVRVGAGCVIAAGAVVREDCEPSAVYGGVPARLISRLNEVHAE